ncbi:MAG: [FeFe] hydrogenase H-cluster radical SAM maturase HydE [Turicibacter sp.]|nr:[FeFe] hydrogenase H-cluster radical SAM maturase HydE [Turicibacter sp.]
MSIIQELHQNRDLPDDRLSLLIEREEYGQELFKKADAVRREYYGTDVYIRGLIEFTNYCGNNCYYCGIRRDNSGVERYRLAKNEILDCCKEGYRLGFRTFVLQGGEDGSFTDAHICEIVSEIKALYPDCAVTLSVGEKPFESLQAYFNAGANRYLLRHETADTAHYGQLHPTGMDLDERKKCLFDIKKIGYEVGTGFMVGSPHQTTEHLIKDLRFLQELRPDMIGIGPFLSHQSTPFRDFENGNLQLCLRLIAILRLMFPYALIPATTALGTLSPLGRELGLKAGANVVMPNLSPVRVRKHYELYDNKICTGDEAAECRVCLENRVKTAGYNIIVDIGNAKTEKLTTKTSGAGAEFCGFTTEERLARSLTAETTELIPFLPYLLQDFWALGSEPSIMVRLLKQHTNLPKTARILDLGCGKGAVSVKIAEQLQLKVTGVDIMHDFIEMARQKAEQVSNLCSFEVGDINLAVLEKTDYDCVILGGTGSVFGDYAETLCKLKQTIKPGGYILIDEAYLPNENGQKVKYPSDDYLTEQEWYNLFDKEQLKLIAADYGEDCISENLDSTAGMAAITNRAKQLIERHPDKAEIFENYVKSQQNEYDDIDNTLVGVTWLLQKI